MKNKNQRNIIVSIIVFVIIALSSTVFNTNLITECPTCVGILAPITYLPILIFAIVLIVLIFTISSFQSKQKFFITILVIALTMLPVVSMFNKADTTRNQSTTYEPLKPLLPKEQQLYSESIPNFFKNSYGIDIIIIDRLSLNIYRSDNITRHVSTEIEILGSPKITAEVSFVIINNVVEISKFNSLAQAIISGLYENYYSNLLEDIKKQNYPDSMLEETTITLDIQYSQLYQPETIWENYVNKYYQSQNLEQIEDLLRVYLLRSIDVRVKTETPQNSLPTTEIITFFNEYIQSLESKPPTAYKITYTGINQETEWSSTITSLYLYY